MEDPCEEQDCQETATHSGVHASSDCRVKVCAVHAEEITRDGHWVPGHEAKPLAAKE